MSSLEDELRLYLDNSLKEFFIKDREKIDSMVLDIERLFNNRETLYKFNKNFIYDYLSRVILNGNKVIKLNNQEVVLLEYLIKNRGTIISYETLISVISKDSSIETLRTVVKRLRAKTDKSIIETFSKVGYRLR